MTDVRDLEIQIARYRFLAREVTDPLAEYLLHSIVVELESDLQARLGALADAEATLAA